MRLRAPIPTAAITFALVVACADGGGRVAPVHSPRTALATFKLPPGYRIELVAAEPLVHDPIAIDFDADGRMYVVEMSGFMPSISGEGEQRPNGKIVVLEDRDDDGRMDKRTVFTDSLILPRTVTVLEHGVLVGAPPFLWLMRDTTGDLRADTREVVRDDYGSADANPEHNANSARWGMDNWLHAANHTMELRLRTENGVTFESRATASLGQWGVSSDEYGRLYRNSNEDPLRTDLIPAHYTSRGVHTALTSNVAVWPVRKTPAINRGYRERTLRPDSTLAHYTSAGSPTAYIGDQFPAEMRQSVFVTEPAGNLVGQFIVTDRANGMRAAARADDSSDFLASTDERFRPVNLANAPDGTLYVVDMYRGIIQHRFFLTDYLEEKIRERGLEQPIGYGRIYRIIHEGSPRDARPQLSRKTSAELVESLTHPNGWWRITAQRLIVERHDRSVAPAVRALLNNPDDRVRLHALWTLEGLDEADSTSVLRVLTDASPHMRAAALRIAEQGIERATAVVRAAVRGLIGDSSLLVQRQLSATLAAFPEKERHSALAAMLDHDVPDAITAELIARASGVGAQDLLEHLLSRTANAENNVTAEALAAAIGRARDAAMVLRVITWARAPSRTQGQRVALLSGLARGASASGSRTPIEIAARPAALQALGADGNRQLAAAASRVENILRWPGKPEPVVNPVRALTPAESTRVAVGREEFGKSCAGCHHLDGTGATGVAASLVGSTYTNGSPLRLIRILLQGKEGTMLMPPVGKTMTDEQVASVLSYIRREWGNSADPIAAGDVKEIRGATMGRRRPWTDAELALINR